MINVVHITENPIAGAPISLSNALNKYQCDKVSSRHIASSDRNEKRVFKSDLLTTKNSYDELRAVIGNAHVLHFHNFYRNQELFRKYPDLLEIMYKKPRVWQVHSPRNTAWMDIDEGLKDEHAIHLVIGQYHPRQWPECKVVPNVIDIYDPPYMPHPQNNKLARVAYSPSRIRLPGWDDKGYDVTQKALQKLVDEGLITAEIIFDQPHDVCMYKRSFANISIDEVVTGSYHLTSLESLSQGLCTIAGLDDIQIATLKSLTGAHTLPWFIARPNTLEDRLRMLAKSSGVVQAYGRDSRQWMEKYWDPMNMTQRFVDIYRRM